MKVQSVVQVTPISDREQLRVVIETALDAAVVMSSTGTVQAWNKQAETVFGWLAHEAIGRQMADLIIPDEYRSAHDEGLRRYLETGEGPVLGRRIEITALRRNGEQFPIELSISPVAKGEELSFLGFIRDISDRRKTENVLRLRAREAVLLHNLTALAGEASFEEVLQECLAAVCELTSWPLGHAFTPSETSPIVLSPTSIWHSPANEFREFRRVTEATTFEPGMGLPGHVWNARGPVWIRDVQDHAIFPRTAAANASGLRSAFGFPLIVGGRIVAILEFFNNDTNEPGESTRLMLQALGAQVARALERRASEESMRREIARREKVERHQALLLHEMDHRVKNMLAVVMSIAAQTGRNHHATADFLDSFNSRMLSLARGYELVAGGNWKPSSLHEIVTQIVAPQVGNKESLKIEGPVALFQPKAVLSLSMIFHELCTNAAKYGALSIEAGRISIIWRYGEDGALYLCWQEFGLTGLPSNRKPGFGTKLINISVSQELGGSVTVQANDEGLRYDFIIRTGNSGSGETENTSP